MRAHGESFLQFAARLSQTHRDMFRRRALDPSTRRHFARLAQESLEKQQQLEASDTLAFGDYLQQYFAQS